MKDVTDPGGVSGASRWDGIRLVKLEDCHMRLCTLLNATFQEVKYDSNHREPSQG